LAGHVEMKIKIISNPITPYGSFDTGKILTDQKYPAAFLIHLVEQAGAAEYMDKEAYLNKVDDAVEIKKKAPSSPSLPQVKASGKKTSTLRKKKRK